MSGGCLCERRWLERAGKQLERVRARVGHRRMTWHVCRARVQEVAHRRSTHCRVICQSRSRWSSGRPRPPPSECGRWWIRWPTHAERESTGGSRMHTAVVVRCGSVCHARYHALSDRGRCGSPARMKHSIVDQSVLEVEVVADLVRYDCHLSPSRTIHHSAC